MEGLSSIEHYHTRGERPRRVLENINLVIKRPESWGIYGRSLLEIKLLLEVMANIKPYHAGRCILVERGMMRNKRVILEHVFYICGPTMLYDNMNVLEFLMFATAKRGSGAVYRQEQIFELLLSIGLGPISLTPIARLTREEKVVVTLLVTAYSESVMIVFNVPEYRFNRMLSTAIAHIAALIKERGKTLIMGSKDCRLIEKSCSHTAYVAEGRMIYQGTVEELRLTYDKILLIIEDPEAPQIMERLAPRLPELHFTLKGRRLLISEPGEDNTDPHLIYENIIRSGFAPRSMKVNPKTVQNAYEEIDRQYDL